MLMIGKALTAEQRLTRAVVTIMSQAPCLSAVLMVGNKEIQDDIPTACTNGKDEYYGREFVDGLNDAEFRFLILHETYHKLYKHLTTWRALWNEDKKLANMACDYVINLKIVDEFGLTFLESNNKFVTMPEDGLLDERFRNMTAKQVFDILKQEGHGGNGGNCKGDGNGNEDSDGSGSDGNGFDDHDWEGAKEMSEADKKELAREIDAAIRQGALTAGKLGSGGIRDLEELLKNKVDWREALREFATTTCTGKEFSTWRRPNRRHLSSGYYLPTSVSEQVEELGIFIDTSGSIGNREIAQFLGEVKAIAETVKPSRIRLLYWDTRVCADETYEGDEVARIIESTKPAGGGGTDITCVCDYLAKNSINLQCAVVLTDGYLGSVWGNWTVPLLWCIVGNERANPPVGQAVHVEWD
jgi:predicted metal-dependent peptidase